MCDKGFFRDPKTGLCKDCDRGTYSTEYDSTSCESCPEGQTTYNVAMPSADYCIGKKTTVLKILLSFWDVRQIFTENDLPDPPPTSCPPGQQRHLWKGCSPCKRGKLNILSYFK